MLFKFPEYFIFVLPFFALLGERNSGMVTWYILHVNYLFKLVHYCTESI